MKKNIIEIKQVKKWFGENQVLSDINLEIKAGEFLTLLGPSGCGKTTLLRLISGFDNPSTGSIFIDGIDVSGIAPEQRYVNMVFQSYALFPHMNVFDNIAFGLRCKGLPKKEIQARVERILARVHLTQLKNRKSHQLSGGQQQRVAIARAVVNEPLVLLLDEPMSALDHGLRKNMRIELKNLQRELGITFVLVTHDQEEALSMSDRVVVMNDGFIEQIGTPRRIYEKPANLYVAQFIGQTNIFETVVLAADAKEIAIEIEARKFKLPNKRGLQQGQKVKVIIRPEDLRSWDRSELEAKEVEQLIPAKVEEVIYKGSTVDLILRTPSGKKIASTEFFDEDDEELDFNIGESVWIEWMIGWEVVLPDDN
jgi:spermidine/putrescine transport system ATP-binding protein